MEARTALADTLGAFGAPDAATLDLYVHAGGQVSANGTWSPNAGASNLKTDGLQIGVIGGTRGGEMDTQGLIIPTDCAPIPSGGFPARPEPANIDFYAEAGAGYRDNFHLALGVSDYFLDKMMYDLYAAGGLCLSIGSGTSSFLNSSLFRTFFGSLGMLADGNDVPMIVAVRPKAPPDIEVGENSFKVVDGVKQPDKPLVLFRIPNLHLDFYALLEDRYVRLFTLKAKVEMPLGIEFDPNGNTLTPLPGELRNLLTELETFNSEILAEDTAVIVDLLGAVIGLAQPFVAGAIQPIELPALLDGKFKLKVRDAKGVVPYGSPIPGFQHVALYTEMEVVPGGVGPALYTVDTRAELAERRVPSREELRIPGAGLRKPVAVVRARALTGRAGPVEFQYRVDGGFWSGWVRRDTFEVSSPVLLVQRYHRIEVRARHQDEPGTADATPAALEFLVDWEAPRLTLVQDDAAGLLRVMAKDAVSAADRLRYEWRFEEGAWQGLEAPEIPLADIQGQAVEVVVSDEAGNNAAARFVSRAHGIHGRTPAPPGGGCGGCGGAGAGAPALLALVFALALRARRRA
jgi:hypothetical protein